VQSRSAAIKTDGMWGITVGGEVLLEPFHGGAEAKTTVIELSGNGAFEFATDGARLHFEIEIGNFHVSSSR
jgi:hypothetical protein